MNSWMDSWRRPLTLTACDSCENLFLRPEETAVPHCPICGQTGLSDLDAEQDKPAHTHPPELVIPFKVSATDTSQPLANFARSFWFAPPDLNSERLAARLQKLYLPLWLVDAQVNGVWSAEAGFNYQAVSHREEYSGGQWRTQQVEETRIRWEQRVGRVQKEYHNQTAPALEEEAALQGQIGPYDLAAAQPFSPEFLDAASARLPNRPPEDAWTDAVVGIQRRAMADCQQAGKADHLREFHWSPEYVRQNWTQLLRPVYATYYLDDDNRPQPILLHGETGKLHGRQRASMKRAKQTAVIIGVVAGLIFLFSLLLAVGGLFEEILLAAAVLGFLAGVGIAVLALIPPFVVWRFNRRRINSD
jgi:hypothetical protein